MAKQGYSWVRKTREEAQQSRLLLRFLRARRGEESPSDKRYPVVATRIDFRRLRMDERMFVNSEASSIHKDDACTQTSRSNNIRTLR